MTDPQPLTQEEYDELVRLQAKQYRYYIFAKQKACAADNHVMGIKNRGIEFRVSSNSKYTCSNCGGEIKMETIDCLDKEF